ncbi:cell division protein FtsQ/DivIB [Mesobacillus zeae]|uniref:Cell division protein DivIB n=1 Tax=Mesobacillus zeae TaxID=1917180 RepID=A0A398BF73_9BACI|nr:cell division protein FtsQ/DivIB [Mesobacillus zeae]RID87911.1 cell division protein FtsQ/DivIB [Mesobacillus zeae]
MDKAKIVSIEERIPQLKQQRRKKANRRLILLLSLFFMLILCVIYFQSPLSKVKQLNVSGNVSYSAAEIKQMSGITTDTNIWKINKSKTESSLEKLPEIKKAEIRTRFPNKVNIHLEEYEKLAYLSKGKAFYPVLGNGKIIEKKEVSQIPMNAPVLIGFREGKPLDKMIGDLASLPAEVLGSISEIHYTPSKSDVYRVTLFMNDGFEVHATLRTFTEKMAHYPAIVAQLDHSEKGVIDLEVGSYFKSYKKEKADKPDEEKANQQ